MKFLNVFIVTFFSVLVEMASKKKKTGGGKGKNDDWEDDEAEQRLKELTLKDAEQAESDDSENDQDKPTKKTNKKKIAQKSAFNMLAALGSDNDEEKKSGDERKSSDDERRSPSPPIVTVKDKKTKSKKPENEDLDVAIDQSKHLPPEKAKKGKKDKKGNKEDDELDALLADLDKPTEKSTKKQKAKEATPVVEAEEGVEQIEGATGQEKLEGEEGKKDKKKKKKKGGAKEKSEEPDPDGGDDHPMAENTGEVDGENDEQEGGDVATTTAKKKKKTKEKKEKEGGGEKKKKKQVDFIKEVLRKKQEAEEEAQRAQQEEEQRREAIRLQREEEERVAKEKKDREKLKKKEREERLKREGKFLTPAQRQKLARQQEMVTSSNVIVPALDDDQPKKRPVYGKKKPQQQKPATLVVDSHATTDLGEAEKTDAKDATPPEDETEAVDQSDDIVDDWEQVHEVEKPLPKSATPSGPSPSPAKVARTRSSDQTADEDEAEASSSEESTSDDEESSEEESDESSEDDEERPGRETKEQIMERVRARIKKRREDALTKRSTDNLRAPVICVLGHVDTGKTKMLDTIRRTNVQDGEAGGITQQIGATQVPSAAIRERCKMVREFNGDTMKIPGFLIIDTPGHECFSNLRSRGSSLCDLAILVVDIMHGLEPQTIESIKLLVKRETPFVIALNKIDRLYNYESNPRKDVWQLLKSQPLNTQLEFKERVMKIVAEFAEQGLNVALANENPDRNEYHDIVPTSAFFGDGIGNLIAHLVYYSESRLAQKLAFCEELDAIVMEVRTLPGLGTTIDVILINGTLKVGDIIILTGTQGAIMTQIRDLLMPQPLKEMRVKNAYEHFPSIPGAQGVKILAKDLEHALAGLPIFVANKEDEVDVLRLEAEQQLSKALMAIKKKPEGVYVQASTLGSLEALLEFLRTQKIPYSNVNIGPVHKRDVQKAAAMLEHKVDYACILAFDVRIEPTAQTFADHEGVRIFHADIIYHLQDNFLAYREELRLKRRKENEHLAIFPCKLRILPQNVFNARNPIVCGVSVEAGQLKRGTPLCVPSKDRLFIGTVSSIQRNHDEVQLAKSGDEVCIKIENTTGEAPKLYGRHFDHTDILVSRISRETIDVCKKHFRDDLSKADWVLVIELKKLLDIF